MWQSTANLLLHNDLCFVLSKSISLALMLLSSFTGMAFADVQQLSKEHLVRDNEDNLWIRNACQKIKQMCNIPVISPAPKLIDKYSNQPDCVAKNVLLPVLSNQKMNAYLKEIADICGIQKRLTTHVARYSKSIS